jgi:hypothetical protein
VSALDKIRSFAEARCEDEEVLKEGFLTYGDCRAVMTQVEDLNRTLNEQGQSIFYHKRCVDQVRDAMRTLSNSEIVMGEQP